MYVPFLYGKQFELLTLRAMAGTNGADILPIVYPVKVRPDALFRAIDDVTNADERVVVISNPRVGEIGIQRAQAFGTSLAASYSANPNVEIGVMLDSHTSVAEIQSLRRIFPNSQFVFVHRRDANFALVAGQVNVTDRHVFINDESGGAYPSTIASSNKIIIQNAFEQKSNADHNFSDRFHDLNISYAADGYVGFGDFTISPKVFSSTGGQPYCVAVHVTYQPTQGANQPTHIYHFLSNDRASAGDAARKSAQALTNMVNHLGAPSSLIYEANGMDELRQLQASGHFPGLGKLKQWQVMHHIELMRTLV